ncbi:DUF6685 family protein [Sulfuriferula nivalis]|uniref:DUF6685 family protein n=1 Tax=Sulfuriferula nivalis TaxID=2675298 RepID=UPI001389543F|nr:DUF6685 family protein [Sulfuriferula nivalis]
MKKLFSIISDNIQTSFGTPIKLLQLLNERSDIRVEINEPNRVIAADSVVSWHRWGESSPFKWPRRSDGRIMGWKYSSGYYCSFEVYRPELADFGCCETTEQWTCDIQNVDGVLHSKSELDKFATLDDMVAKNSPEMINEVTKAMLCKNLAHGEIRILHNSDTSDHFARYQWDGRVFLMNGGGSHHFAAARYIASRIAQQVPLKGKLCTYSINDVAVGMLCRDFDIYAISDEAEISNRFHDAMESFKATYLLHDMPKPYGKAKAILLPKNDARSVRVSKVLREVGVADLGHHFAALCNRQSRNKAQPV